MDQYSPTYTNDRAAKDQMALLAALAALLLAAVVVVFFLGQAPQTSGKDQVTAVAIAEMQRPTTALAGTVAGVLVAPIDGPPSLVGGATKENYPWIKGKVTALLQTDVGLWAATTGPGEVPASVSLVRNPIGENPFVQQIALPPQFAGAEIRALVQGLGRLYIGTSKGLLSYDFSKLGAFTPPSRYRLPGMSTHLDVTALYLDNAGTLWVGTRDGLLSFNGSEAFRHTVKEGLPSNVITALSGDQAGLVYAGTDKGLSVYERGIWVRHAEVNGHVNAVLAAEDNVWVGTTDGLFQRLEGRWVHYDDRSKLPSTAVLGLAWGADGVYVSTEPGLYKVSVEVAAAPDETSAKSDAGHRAPAGDHGPAAPASALAPAAH